MPPRRRYANPPHPDAIIVFQTRAWSDRFVVNLIGFRRRRFGDSMSTPRTWELWRRDRAVAFVPYDPVNDSVVLIEQWYALADGSRG
jgi:ADP-ribose pyrophosphatase